MGKHGSARDKRGRRGFAGKSFRGQLAVLVPKKNKKAFRTKRLVFRRFEKRKYISLILKNFKKYKKAFPFGGYINVKSKIIIRKKI